MSAATGGLARFGLIALLAAATVAVVLGALLLSSASPVGAQAVDYDTDDDNLIEVSMLVQLNAIRHDLNGNGDSTHADYTAAFRNAASGMGCAATCTGYELTADLDFDQNNDHRITSADAAWWNGGAGWVPIGTWGNPFNATFDGGGHTISNLYIRVGGGDSGLFGSTGASGVIRNLGMVNPSIDRTGSLTLDSAAAVAGSNRGTIQRVFVSGGDIWAYAKIGGVVGHNRGEVSDSYSSMAVTGNTEVGGLVGWNDTDSGVITNSYAVGSVATHEESGVRAGSQVHYVPANYGGLVGRNGGSATVTASYWDATTSGQAASAAGTTQTTAELQSPTGATGIYSTWATATWDFGTASQYPALKYDTDEDGVATAYEFGRQGRSASVVSTTDDDYDDDNDGLIEVSDLAQLNAIRWDLDGDGASTDAGYDLAFPNPAPGMGCPDTDGDAATPNCTGYELRESLDFDENSDSTITSDDVTYWNGGKGWQPVGTAGDGFRATFDGNGSTISNLFIARGEAGSDPGDNDVGLFGVTSAEAILRNVAVADVQVAGRDHVGALVGQSRGVVVNASSSGRISSGAVTGEQIVGGLAGYNGGLIALSHSSADVIGSTGGGLVGWNRGEIRATYATGDVTGSAGVVGGLVGAHFGGYLQASYATGTVDTPYESDIAEKLYGGLTGRDFRNRVVDSYWDTEASGQSISPSGQGKTTAELQTPAGYSGIYADWNLDLDNADGDNDDGTGPDDPWDFGSASDYPALNTVVASVIENVRLPNRSLGAGTANVDYDADDDGLIDVDSLAKLNGLRWDLNGNGAADDSANNVDYQAAYPDAEAGMGCPAGGCMGYELTGDLDFDSNADGVVDGSDHGDVWWDGSKGWNPIGNNPWKDYSEAYNAVFEGNGHTISNLFINREGERGNGLFGALDVGAVVRNVGLNDVNLTGGGYTAAFAGESSGLVKNVYATGRLSGSGFAGGLVGKNHHGTVANSWSAVKVSGRHLLGSIYMGPAGGLVGFNWRGTVRNSYARGPVHGSKSVGGLIGANNSYTTVENSYSIGPVDRFKNYSVGGLFGLSGAGRIPGVYWNQETSGRAFDSSGPGKTTAELQTPTSASGIYADWDPATWDFGTAIQYPALKVDFNGDGTATWEEFGSQRPTGLILFEGEGVTREVLRGLTAGSAVSAPLQALNSPWFCKSVADAATVPGDDAIHLEVSQDCQMTVAASHTLNNPIYSIEVTVGTDADVLDTADDMTVKVTIKTLVDYDTDNDHLIDIRNLDQLNAIRWDLNAKGPEDSAGLDSYLKAFPDAAPIMGCRMVYIREGC